MKGQKVANRAQSRRKTEKRGRASRIANAVTQAQDLGTCNDTGPQKWKNTYQSIIVRIRRWAGINTNVNAAQDGTLPQAQPPQRKRKRGTEELLRNDMIGFKFRV